MKHRYTDILANAFSEARAWKLTTLCVSGLCAMLAITLVWQAASTPVVLVPAGLAESSERVTINPRNFEGTSPDYLAQTALGDLALILNWQPSNVELQYQRFLNRLTSVQYARQSAPLIAEAQRHRSTGASQSFFPEDVQVDLRAGRVMVKGYLVRWEGSKEVLRQPARFAVTYVNQKGFLYVADIELENN